MIFIGNVDGHFVISLFGITIRIKDKKINYLKYKRYVVSYGLNTESREVKITASLTSFPERINNIYKTIECLLTQTVKPDRLVLWLAENQFPNKENALPENILRLKDYGLEIKWCDDLRSYKKLIPTLKEYPNDIIITFDDDIYYPKNTIEVLYKKYQENPNCIYANRCCRLVFDNRKLRFVKTNRMFLNYKKWQKPSSFNTIIGCGGVLYPPDSLHDDVLDIDKARRLSPTQDDIWFTVMAILKKTPICLVEGPKMSFVTVENTQECGLCKVNFKDAKGMSGQEALESVLTEYSVVNDILQE